MLTGQEALGLQRGGARIGSTRVMGIGRPGPHELARPEGCIRLGDVGHRRQRLGTHRPGCTLPRDALEVGHRSGCEVVDGKPWNAEHHDLRGPTGGWDPVGLADSPGEQGRGDRHHHQAHQHATAQQRHRARRSFFVT